MKKSISLIALALCCVFAFEANAQMDKKEKKEWKKRIKKLEPEQYKQLLDENKSLKGQVTSLKTELGNIDDRLAEKDEQILTYQAQIGDLREELSRLQSKQPADNVASRNTGGSIDESKGVVFKVQLGAFKQKDLKKYDNSPNFSAEDADGLQKYTIGVFRDYWEADTFKKYLREMGVKDAWVVSYKDGVRVPIKEVLEGVTKKS
ncbi:MULTISPECIES: Ezrin/radixin/moesin family protein [unclassified Ekhidna]|uniref:Ezrin/radixin/moesin family protein n=1 Tax=unclassified Ekhidna TaxID=2632188 RepID=UPI0032E01F6B